MSQGACELVVIASDLQGFISGRGFHAPMIYEKESGADV